MMNSGCGMIGAWLKAVTRRSRATAASLLLMALLPGLTGQAISATANLVNNGDFANVGGAYKENVSLGADDLLTGGGTDIPGWLNLPLAGVPASYANEMWIQPINGYGVTDSPGNTTGYFVDLTGEANAKPYGGLEQKIATTPGMGYTLTFDLGASTAYNSSGLGAAALTASANGTRQLVTHHFTLVPTESNQWVTETLTFIADSDSTTISFLADSGYTSRYVGLDHVVMVSRPLSTSTNLTVSTSSATPGTAVSMTALVAAAGGTVTPTGQVQFKSGAQVLGTATLNGAAQATINTTALAVGTDPITAVYLGNTIYSASTSNTVNVTVAAGATHTTLSATPLTAAVGSTVTFTALVKQSSGSTPTGTVKFVHPGSTLGTVALNSSGIATFSTKTLAAATYTVTAVYSGDAHHPASSSGAVKVTITGAKTTSTTTLSITPTSAAVGTKITFQAVVKAAAGARSPTGTVQFVHPGSTLGTASLNSAGVATFSTGSLPAATYNVTAIYSGDTADGSSTSSTVRITIK